MKVMTMMMKKEGKISLKFLYELIIIDITVVYLMKLL